MLDDITTTILQDMGIFIRTMQSEKPVKTQDLEMIITSFDGAQEKEIIMQNENMFDSATINLHDVSVGAANEEHSPPVTTVIDKKGKHIRKGSRTVNEVEKTDVGKSGRYAFDDSIADAENTLGKKIS